MQVATYSCISSTGYRDIDIGGQKAQPSKKAMILTVYNLTLFVQETGAWPKSHEL